MSFPHAHTHTFCILLDASTAYSFLARHLVNAIRSEGQQAFSPSVLKQGEAAMVAMAAQVWAASPQRAAMAIDRLMALRLAGGGAIVEWAFGALAQKRFNDELGAGAHHPSWNNFTLSPSRMLTRTPVTPML